MSVMSSLFLQVQHILFNPLGYMHPTRLNIPEGLVQTDCTKRVVNRLILDSLALDSEQIDISVHTLRFIKYWDEFENIAWVIGCCLSAPRLTWQGKITHIPNVARHYFPVKKSDIESVSEPNFSEESVIRLGFTQLYPLVAELSLSFRQRFPLLFAPAISDAEPVTSVPVNASLLNMAVNYVKNNQIVFSRDRHRRHIDYKGASRSRTRDAGCS